MQRAQLLKNTSPSASHPRDTWRHDIVNSEVRVPGDDTTYWCRVHRLPAALRTKHHVVQVRRALRTFAFASVREGLVLIAAIFFKV
jgi:dopamine beta-monooxygenase